MSFEAELVANLALDGYHPRSSRHSDFQSSLIIRHLIDQCDALKKKAATGEVVAQLRHHQQVGHADWVVDIAIGTGSGAPVPPPAGEAIRPAPPVIIQIAIELKAILTEHGKARKNRLRDFNSFHGYAHEYNPKTVAGAFLMVNSSRYFYSPLRKEDDITDHNRKNASARKIANNAVDIFRSIHLRNSAVDAPGMEAIGVVVVEHDNLQFHPDKTNYLHQHSPTVLAPSPPNPKLGDPLHYQSMLQRLCMAYTERFG
jgi:hypothetical protein